MVHNSAPCSCTVDTKFAAQFFQQLQGAFDAVYVVYMTNLVLRIMVLVVHLRMIYFSCSKGNIKTYCSADNFADCCQNVLYALLN
jgi:hypothetical protein